MLPLVLLRPEPGWSASAAAARALGLTVAGAPLFAIEPVAWDAPDQVDALLLGSANAPRCAGPALANFMAIPTYAVGTATAEAARGAGLSVIAVGEDDMVALSATIDPAHRVVLRLAGRERTVLPPLPGHEVIERTVYAAVAVPLAPVPAEAVVMLHSPRAAALFVAECARFEVSLAGLAIAALSSRVAAAVGPGWARVQIAAEPTDAALLALARKMCEIRAKGAGGLQRQL